MCITQCSLKVDDTSGKGLFDELKKLQLDINDLRDKDMIMDLI